MSQNNRCILAGHIFYFNEYHWGITPIKNSVFKNIHSAIMQYKFQHRLRRGCVEGTIFGNGMIIIIGYPFVWDLGVAPMTFR